MAPSGPGTGFGESFAQTPFPAGTLSKLRVRLITQNVPTSGSLTAMVRVNGADSTLTCTLTETGVCTSGNKTKAVNNNGLVALQITSDLADAGNTSVL